MQGKECNANNTAQQIWQSNSLVIYKKSTVFFTCGFSTSKCLEYGQIRIRGKQTMCSTLGRQSSVDQCAADITVTCAVCSVDCT